MKTLLFRSLIIAMISIFITRPGIASEDISKLLERKTADGQPMVSMADDGSMLIYTDDDAPGKGRLALSGAAYLTGAAAAILGACAAVYIFANHQKNKKDVFPDKDDQVDNVLNMGVKAFRARLVIGVAITAIGLGGIPAILMADAGIKNLSVISGKSQDQIRQHVREKSLRFKLSPQGVELVNTAMVDGEQKRTPAVIAWQDVGRIMITRDSFMGYQYANPWKIMKEHDFPLIGADKKYEGWTPREISALLQHYKAVYQKPA